MKLELNFIIEDEEPVKMATRQLIKCILPHICLLFITAIYVCIGGALFMEFIPPNLERLRKQQEFQLSELKDKLADSLWNIPNTPAAENLDAGEEALNAYIESLYRIYTATESNMMDFTGNSGVNGEGVDPLIRKSEEGTFGNGIFFMVTMLTTIGYGNIVPVEESGRIYCILYSIIGIPLILITTADIAKFLSAGVIAVYVRFLEIKEQLIDCCYRCCKRKREVTEVDDLEEMAEYIWANVENIQYVQVHAAVIFFIVVMYSCLGGAIFSWLEDWSFNESFYFSFISILKIGFGDVVPEKSLSRWVTIFYALIGLTISTMCIDVVGISYVDRIHRFGRIMEKGDYLEVLKRIKYHKRRDRAMSQLHNTLIALANIQLGTISSAKSLSGSGSGKSVSTTLLDPPEIPENVHTTKVTPYSIKLAWTPPEEPISRCLRFVLKYKIKHSKTQSTVCIQNVMAGEYEIYSLTSFSIYEIGLHAVNKLGRSNSIRLVQITEPESSPQDLSARLENLNAVTLTWCDPFKQLSAIQCWAIYYTTDETAPFDNWTKIVVGVKHYTVTIPDLTEDKKYSFCISSMGKEGHSPISCPICITTGEQKMLEQMETERGLLMTEEADLLHSTSSSETDTNPIPADEAL